MMDALIALIGAVASMMPSLVQLLMEARARKERVTDALIQRDLDVLRGPPADGVPREIV